MNCARCQTELEDFPGGELSDATMAAVRAHLIACADCRSVRGQLEAEHELFSRYYEQTALEPSAEMWDAIRRRIAPEPAASALPPEHRSRLREWLASVGFERLLSPSLLSPAMLRQAVFAAALVIVSVAATALYFSLNRPSPSGGPAIVSATPAPQFTPAPGPTASDVLSKPPSPTPEKGSSVVGGKNPEVKTPRSVPASLSKKLNAPALNEDALIQQQVAKAAREYQGAIQLLERKIARRRDALDPNVIAQYEQSLELINNSIVASRRALRQQQGDPAAGQFLLAAYAKKVELMQEIALQ